MKTKFIKTAAMIVSILIIISSTIIISAAAGSATISAGQIGSVNPGQTVTIPVSISNNTGIMGFSISFDYDKNALTPVSATSGTIISGLFDDSIGTSEAGSFDVVWSGTEDCTQNGVLFNVTFAVNSNATGTTKIDVSYSQADTFNEKWEDVGLDCKDIDLTIGNQQATEPTLTVGNVNTLANKTVIVPVNISSNFSIKNLNVSISYNKDMLIPKSVSGEKYTVTSNNVSDANGTLSFNLSSDSPEEGIAVNIEFFIKSEADGKYYLNASASSLKCVAGSITVTTPDGTAYISADSFETLRGETITVPVKINSNSGIMGYRLTFAYDYTVLTPVSAVAGSGFSGNIDNSIGITTGTFDVVWSNSSNITVNGNIVVLTFKINDDADFGKSSVGISYTQGDTFDEGWNDVKLICSDIVVDVKSVIISGEKDSLKSGETLQLDASTDASGNSEGVIWSSSDETIATVDSIGKVTAVGSGTVTITAYDKNGSTSIQITVVKSYICPDCGEEILGEDAINAHIEAENAAKIKTTVKIKNNPGSKTINYGETLRLTAITTDMPANAKIYWYVDGVKKGEGETFNVSLSSGSVEITVKVVDANGNVLVNTNGNEVSDSQKVSVNSSFWQKIVSFFKNLFGMNRTIVQAFKGVF